MQSISSTALEILETGALIGVSMACSNGLTITEDDIIQGTFVLDRNSVSGNIIEIGNAETSQISFVLDNHDGRYNAYSFESATLTVDFVIGLETLRAGIFIIDSSPQKTETMNITALDYMAKFNQEYSTALSDGATLLQILQDCCTTCGVTLATTTFTNSSYAALIPTEEVTFHEVVAWVAQLSGTNAWIDESGELNLSWYGAAGFDITPDNRFEGFSFSEKDITITGVTYRDQDGDVSAGTSGYAFIIEGNPLIDPDDASTIVTAIYGAVGGLTYRPYDAHLMGYPHLWPLDGVTITFPDGITTTYSIITNHRFSLNGTSLVKALGETEQAHGYIPPASLTSAQKTLIKSYAATAALTAANGKNTIYYAPTQPTGGTYIPGDTWFDTDDGNKIYEYNGTSWLSVQFGENAIADLAITDAKIANATISNAKIANVDAGKITTGVLDASLVNIKTGTGTSRVEIVGTGINGYLSDVLRVQLEYDRLEFHRAGSSIGNIRTEYVNQYWGGSILGDCLFIESAGKSIAFNAESGSTAPSLVVFPTWAEAPSFETEYIGVGQGESPKEWSITTDADDSDFYIKNVLGNGITLTNSELSTEGGLIVKGVTSTPMWGGWHKNIEIKDDFHGSLVFTGDNLGIGFMLGFHELNDRFYIARTADSWSTGAYIFQIDGDGTVSMGKVPWARLTNVPSFALSSHTHSTLNASIWNRSQTSSGYIDFGPANTSAAHICTDRPIFYFDKPLSRSGNTVWDAGNDGSGSGLDADLLDGKHLSDLFDTSGSYIGLVGSNNYIRTPLGGIIPQTMSSSGTGNVGTASWKFLNGYITNVYASVVDTNTGTIKANKYIVSSGTSYSYFGWNSTYGLVISRASSQDNQILFFQNSFGELGICPTVTNKGDLGQSTSANNWYRGYATAWNSASTVDNKINITRADDSEYYELAKLMNVYLYSTDDKKQDLRFGLLTEESPAEIVGLDNNTKSGKAIDLYAFTTFNFAVIKVLQGKVEQLENELEVLKNGAIKTI